MLITSLSCIDKYKAEIRYKKLELEYMSELPNILDSIHKRMTKVRLLNAYNIYFSKDINGKLYYTKNIADGIQWRDYDVLFIPEYNEIGSFEQSNSLVGSLGDKLLVIEQGRMSKILLMDTSKWKEIIIISMSSGHTDWDALFANDTNLERVVMIGNQNLRLCTLSNTFRGCTKLKEAVILNTNFSDFISLSSTFYGCKELETIYFDKFNRIELEYISSCFYNCCKLREIDLSMLSTRNVGNMASLFMGCNSLEKIDLSSFNIDRVRSFRDMFCNCTNLVDINIATWDLRYNSDIAGMLANCLRLDRELFLFDE